MVSWPNSGAPPAEAKMTAALRLATLAALLAPTEAALLGRLLRGMSGQVADYAVVTIPAPAAGPPAQVSSHGLGRLGWVAM